MIRSNHRVLRVATTTLRCTFHHDGKKLAQASEGGGMHAHPLYYIYYRVYKVVVYAQGRYLPLISTLPLCVLCVSNTAICVWLYVVTP
jgi:hypothetical protein